MIALQFYPQRFPALFLDAFASRFWQVRPGCPVRSALSREARPLSVCMDWLGFTLATPRFRPRSVFPIQLTGGCPVLPMPPR